MEGRASARSATYAERRYTITAPKRAQLTQPAVPVAAEFDRTAGVGGSDVAPILGISPWTSRVDVWMEKTHHPHYRPQAQTPAMRWGNLLEPVLRAEYSRDTGLAVVHEPDVTIWADNHIQYAHLDGWVDPDGIWEGKTGSGDWPGGVPDYYLVQVQQYLSIARRSWCDLSAYLPATPQRFHTWRIEADEIRQLHIQQEVEAFWHDYVLTGQAPPEVKDPVILWPAPVSDDLMLVATDEQDLDAKTLLEVKRRGKALEADELAIKDRLMAAIGPAAGMVGDGWYILFRDSAAPQSVGWEAVSTSLWNTLEAIRRDVVYGQDPESVDPKLAPYLDPALFDTLRSLYTTTGKPSRPFNLKAGEYNGR